MSESRLKSYDDFFFDIIYPFWIEFMESKMLIGRLKENLILAMKEKNQLRVSTLRMINAAIKDLEISKRSKDKLEKLTEEDIIGILVKMVKQRKESATTYKDGNRIKTWFYSTGGKSQENVYNKDGKLISSDSWDLSETATRREYDKEGGRLIREVEAYTGTIREYDKDGKLIREIKK